MLGVRRDRPLEATGREGEAKEKQMASSYVLVLTILTTPIDGVETQRVPGFNSIQECAEHAAGWGMPQPLQPGSQIIWECQKDE